MKNIDKKYLLVLDTDKFEDGWSNLKSSYLKLAQLFPDQNTETEVKTHSLKLLEENLPMCILDDKLVNSFWNLLIQSNKFFLKTNTGISVGYTIDYDRNEEGVVVYKKYHFSVMLTGRDDYTRKLLLSNGWSISNDKVQQ